MLRRLTRTAVETWRNAAAYAVLPLLAGVAHLGEVWLLDARATTWMRHATGHAFDALPDLALRLDPRAQPLVTAYYLLAFLAFLAWTPGLLAASGQTRLLKQTLLCYPILYLLALPGFLLYPADNPYTRAGEPSPFHTLHPDLETAYYWLTTPNNTLPSLHVAFTLVLATALWRAWPLWRPSIGTHAALLILSVLLIRVHSVWDVIAGAGVAWIAWRIAEKTLDGPIGTALDRASARIWTTRSATAAPRTNEPTTADD